MPLKIIAIAIGAFLGGIGCVHVDHASLLPEKALSSLVAGLSENIRPNLQPNPQNAPAGQESWLPTLLAAGGAALTVVVDRRLFHGPKPK